MGTIMGKDRDSYRCMRSSNLIEEVKYALPGTDWQELAIALSERLESKVRYIEEDARRDPYEG